MQKYKPLLFLHGWGLGPHAYRPAIKQLLSLGFTVYAPALPGFSRTPSLPVNKLSIEEYAKWVEEFLTMKIGGDQVTVLGHSFGGGIAIKLAHKFPERVSAIILINSIGSPVWISNGKATQRMSERPLWNWGQNLIADLILSTNWFRVFPHILVDALPNLIYRPLDMWKVATMIRRADLSAEIKQLKQRKLPVLPVWSDRDQLISKASFDALCQAIGHKGKTVRGSHAWLIENPDIFIETVLSFLSLPHNFNKRDFPIGTGTWLPARG